MHPFTRISELGVAVNHLGEHRRIGSRLFVPSLTQPTARPFAGKLDPQIAVVPAYRLRLATKMDRRRADRTSRDDRAAMLVTAPNFGEVVPFSEMKRDRLFAAPTVAACSKRRKVQVRRPNGLAVAREPDNRAHLDIAVQFARNDAGHMRVHCKEAVAVAQDQRPASTLPILDPTACGGANRRTVGRAINLGKIE